jgi:2,4-dienoyl-CoA reductase-like NADH-dependent reductase (Old Yellow Enzyme family)
VLVEASAVCPEGRISPDDSGIWSAEHAQAFQPITRFIKEQGAVPGIQLAHAGRKASTDLPWRGGRPLRSDERGWVPVAPSALAFDTGYPVPRELDAQGISEVVERFEQTTHHALQAGFEVVEIHMAHGYLLHSFLSPLANRREDEYGGSLANRMRLPLAVARAVRAAWPMHLPVFARISVTDWVAGGWDLAQSIVLAQQLKELGLDLIDCSSGGVTAKAEIPTGSGYQTPFAAAIRREVKIPTGAVGMITAPAQAEHILRTEQADVVLLARAMLNDPYWPLHAARELGAEVAWPVQYGRAR